ncbi:MAG TPA: hypothetical protein VFC09_03300 [Candidatus Dormibacteraeota bacterium]|nr:hypothetical protein [Candidatus Dormibacteraeota bacterium]
MSGSGRRLARLAGGAALAVTGALAVASALTLSPHGSGFAPLAASADSPPSPTPTATPTPSPTPRPTDTPRPTWTPRPTATPRPTPAPPPPTLVPAPPPATPGTAGTAHPLVITPLFGSPLVVRPAATTAASPRPTAAVLGFIDPTPLPTTATTITPITGGGPPGGATPVSSPRVTELTAAGLGGTAALLGIAVAWRVLRPRRPLAVAGTLSAGGEPGEAAVAAAPESALFREWRGEIDDIADLAVLTVPPEEQSAARQRRRAFSADALARRLTRSVEQQAPDGT